jgi:hypothetical protein
MCSPPNPKFDPNDVKPVYQAINREIYRAESYVARKICERHQERLVHLVRKRSKCTAAGAADAPWNGRAPEYRWTLPRTKMINRSEIALKNQTAMSVIAGHSCFGNWIKSIENRRRS